MKRKLTMTAVKGMLGLVVMTVAVAMAVAPRAAAETVVFQTETGLMGNSRTQTLHVASQVGQNRSIELVREDNDGFDSEVSRYGVMLVGLEQNDGRYRAAYQLIDGVKRPLQGMIIPFHLDLVQLKKMKENSPGETVGAMDVGGREFRDCRRYDVHHVYPMPTGERGADYQIWVCAGAPLAGVVQVSEALDGMDAEVYYLSAWRE